VGRKFGFNHERYDCAAKNCPKREEKGKTMDTRAILDHQFVVAAYAITWAIQLGYLAWLGLKGRAQKRDATRTARNRRIPQ
jgi:hypothetical protein